MRRLPKRFFISSPGNPDIPRTIVAERIQGIVFAWLSGPEFIEPRDLLERPGRRRRSAGRDLWRDSQRLVLENERLKAELEKLK